MDLPTVAARVDPVARRSRSRTATVWLLALWKQPHQRRLAVALVAAAAAAVAFARVTEDYLTNDPLAHWDVSFARWLADHRSASGVDIFRTITNLGSPAVSLVVATVVCLLLYRRRHLADAALLPLALAGGELLNLGLKLAFHRPRPEVGVVHLDTYSYPSGHAMIAAVTYGAFAYLFWGRIRSHRRRVLMSLGMLTVVSLISFSRLYLGAHYLSDVLGGLTAGASWLALAIALRMSYGERGATRFAGSRADGLARRITRS